MGNWFYVKDGEKQGPFTLDELKSKNIKGDTLVWTASMSDWKKAEDVDAMKGLFEVEPPPIPSAAQEQDNPTKEDQSTSSEANVEEEDDDAGFYGEAAYKAGIVAIVGSMFSLWALSDGDVSTWKMALGGILYLFSYTTTFIALAHYLIAFHKFDDERSQSYIMFIIIVEFALIISLFILPLLDGGALVVGNFVISMVGLASFICLILLCIKMLKIKGENTGVMHAYCYAVFVTSVIGNVIFIGAAFGGNEREVAEEAVLVITVLGSIPFFILSYMFRSAKKHLENNTSK